LTASTFEDANATLSEVGSLKNAEIFAACGIKLHELILEIWEPQN